jgi:ribonucleotide monophosphatase NagD (HAD superfamily)
MTSGEVTHRMLSERPAPRWQELGRTCIHVTWGARGAIDIGAALGLTCTTDPDKAGFILAHGVEALGVDGDGEPESRRIEEIEALLTTCAPRGLLMIVANPDIVTVSGKELRRMPGSLARHYAAAGGAVWLAGKPASVIYEEALRELGLERGEVLAVGDSAAHDVAGARCAGIDTLFVAGGIHADAFERDGRLTLDASGVGTWFAGEEGGAQAPPNFCMGYLKW